MATSAIPQTHGALSPTSAQVADTFADSLTAASQPEASYLAIVPKSALGGAKALMAAMGVEAIFALCLCGVWHLWHMLR